ncbi:hypothetical protein DRJ22_02215 [Candidatus Woesearchaeota archaeon]|nr:MAG: hypothetical protein B6U93_01100 [Candidatus Woesearchaeota archaeon ex4484_78]RLE46318.1 MAG: hypothetical protein DRJ22_02215 [Candidatus Woesearchaeota archaeon]
MIKAIIFDLDNTIYSTKSVGRNLFKPVMKVIKKNNDFLSENDLKSIEKDLWFYNLDLIAKKYSFPLHFYNLVKNAYFSVRIKKSLRPFADFRIIKGFPCLKFLVTAGSEVLQQSKIEALGIRHYFNDIFISSFNEFEGFKGKEQIFQDIIQNYNFNPSQVLVVGDDPSSEIVAGNNLGLVTVQMCKKVKPCDNALFHVKNFYELKRLLIKWNLNKLS